MMDQLRDPVTWAATLTGTGLMWAQSVNVGAWGAAITGLGFAAVGVYSYFQKQRIAAYRDMRQAEIDMQAEADRKLGPSLSRQLAAIVEELRVANAAVVVARQSEEAAKAEAVEARHELLEVVRAGNERTVRHTDNNARNIEALKAHLEESERHMDDLVTPAARNVEEVKAKVEVIEKVVTGSGIIQIPPGLKDTPPEAPP